MVFHFDSGSVFQPNYGARLAVIPSSCRILICKYAEIGNRCLVIWSRRRIANSLLEG